MCLEKNHLLSAFTCSYAILQEGEEKSQALKAGSTTADSEAEQMDNIHFTYFPFGNLFP